MTTKQKLKKIWRNIRLPLLFTVLFTVLQIAAFFGTIAIFHFLKTAGIPIQGHRRTVSTAVFTIINLISGTLLAFIAMRIFLYPANKYIEGMDRIANGDYTVNINIQKLPIYRRFSEHFNKMVAELNLVEMLSNDFINNFSHEFKTPIVSIKGFAAMLKREDLTETERDEYLDIIINESERLAELSTSVLTLSKIEQQSILSDITSVNISEQIRRSISIIYNKWERKNIDFSLNETEDIFLSGNEKLLEQVWINILDNAAKFSPDNGNVEVLCETDETHAKITFTNACDTISEETLTHIFDKFYQGDTSHKVKGNGLGLSIAQKIINIHGGNITAQQTDGKISININISNS